MKNLLVFLGLFVFMGMLSGCSDTKNTTTTASNTSLQDLNKTGTLQGTIYDAVTGDRIGGSDLQIFLIQGSSNRGPDKLNTGSTDPLVGEYAFNNIPVTFADYTYAYPYNMNTTYKVVAIKPGYQRFEAEFTLEGTFPVDYNGEPVPGIVEAVYGRIGNIYLFPLGTASGDVNIYVYDETTGTPIPNAVVYLNQDTKNNSPLVKANSLYYNTDSSTDRLFDTTGLIASLTATTDTAGKATFASATLTIGGRYQVVVPGVSFQGEQLATNNTNTINIGTDAQTRVINMTVIGNTLYAVSASNQVPGTITANGVLTVTFSQPIILSPADTFTVTMFDSNAVGVVTSPLTGVLDATQTILTLTPAITTAPTGPGSFIRYAYPGTIFLKNSQTDSGLTLFSNLVNITTGDDVSGDVQLLTN